MPSTHLSLFYHIVFSTKNRYPFIKESWEPRLHGYIGGIIRELSGVAVAVGGIQDHVHIEARLRSTHCLARFVQDVKTHSSLWVHREIGSGAFSWQDGYGAFTVGSSEVDVLKRYIVGQKEHHRKKSFQEEYLELLRKYGIEFDERYLW